MKLLSLFDSIIQWFNLGNNMVSVSISFCLSYTWPPYIYDCWLTGILNLLQKYLDNRPSELSDKYSAIVGGLYSSFQFMDPCACQKIVSNPTYLLQILQIMCIMEAHGASFLNQIDILKVNPTTSKMIESLMNSCIVSSYCASPELIQFLKDHIISDESWTRKSLFIILLTELQVNGYDICLTPEFLASVLRLENKIVIKMTTRLLALNPSVYTSAVCLLSPDELDAYLCRLAMMGFTDPFEVVPKKKGVDRYSPVLTVLLKRQLAITSQFSCIDTSCMKTVTIDPCTRYITQVFRVGEYGYSYQ